MKCGADERRRRGLDRAEHLFSPTAKMQTNLFKSTHFKATHGVVFFIWYRWRFER